MEAREAGEWSQVAGLGNTGEGAGGPGVGQWGLVLEGTGGGVMGLGWSRGSTKAVPVVQPGGRKGGLLWAAAGRELRTAREGERHERERGHCPE